MKIVDSIRFVLPAAAVVHAGLSLQAQEHANPPSIVTWYCSGCHGVDGRSQLPYIPHLAGLNATYATRKLAAFKAAESVPVDETFSRIARAETKTQTLTHGATVHMVGTAHALPEEKLLEASQWYAGCKPAPAGHGKAASIEQGKELYVNGDRSQGVPACQGCHGPNAQGLDKAPRLAGQHAAYILSQLAMFRTYTRPDQPMTEVARQLDPDQARALAAYLQSRQ